MFPLGIPVGPDVMIVDEDLHPICLSSALSTNTTGVGVTGNIFLRGPPCFGEKIVMIVADIDDDGDNSHVDSHGVFNCVDKW